MDNEEQIKKSVRIICPKCGNELDFTAGSIVSLPVFKLSLEQKDDDGNYMTYCTQCGEKQKMELKE